MYQVFCDGLVTYKKLMVDSLILFLELNMDYITAKVCIYAILFMEIHQTIHISKS